MPQAPSGGGAAGVSRAGELSLSMTPKTATDAAKLKKGLEVGARGRGTGQD